jgi:hypothetical protein
LRKDEFSTIILMNINIINAPTILIEEGTKGCNNVAPVTNFCRVSEHLGFYY